MDYILSIHRVLLSAVSRQLLAVSYAALPRLYSAPGAEMLRKTALPFWRAADCRPYGNDRKIGAKAVGFCVEKLHCVFAGRQITVPKKSVTNQMF